MSARLADDRTVPRSCRQTKRAPSDAHTCAMPHHTATIVYSPTRRRMPAGACWRGGMGHAGLGMPAGACWRGHADRPGHAGWGMPAGVCQSGHAGRCRAGPWAAMGVAFAAGRSVGSTTMDYAEVIGYRTGFASIALRNLALLAPCNPSPFSLWHFFSPVPPLRRLLHACNRTSIEC